MATSDPHRQYTRNAALDVDSLAVDPLQQLRDWVAEARQSGMIDPTAMTLACVDPDGQPSARVVLMRGLDHGVIFFTDYDSRKGRALAAEPRVAATFWWDRLERCVRLEGRAEKLDRAASTAYFRERPRGSQLAAVASRQSQPVDSREALEARLQETAIFYADNKVPCPERWGGFRILPKRVEFWAGRDNRAHDRLMYTRAGDGWRITRLQP